MNPYEQHIKNLEDELAAWSAKNDAIKEIKNNPGKYPEFDFWKPGYDAEGWVEKAIKDFDEMADDKMKKMPVVFKLCAMRHYRKLGQMYRKGGKKDLVDTLQHWTDVMQAVKKLHPEFFKV